MRDLIIALDLPTTADALALVDALGESAAHYKVGAQLFTRSGPEFVRELKDRGKRVFLDLKYHDIPYTVARSVESAAELGVDMLTVHASGGSAMMRAARDAVAADGPILVGVTLLTSFSAADVEEVWDKELRSLRDDAARLAALAAAAGLDGVVASTADVEAVKRHHGSDFVVVTPGIRPEGTAADDQTRIATPTEAVNAGADYLVVGRPVHAADVPAAAFQALQDEIAAARATEAS